MLHLERKDLKRLIDKGFCALVIGDKLRASAPSIAKYAKKFGMFSQLKINGQVSRNLSISDVELAKHLTRNLSVIEIAYIYNCSTTTIRKYIRKFKLEHLLIRNNAIVRKELKLYIINETEEISK